MDKKQRKKWQAQHLERLGVKAERPPRCNAKIGVGLNKKRKQREAKEIAEAVAAGNVRLKGTGKRNSAVKGELLAAICMVVLQCRFSLIICESSEAKRPWTTRGRHNFQKRSPEGQESHSQEKMRRASIYL